MTGRIIGVLILLAIFAGMFVVMGHSAGYFEAIKIFAFSISLTALVYLAVWLITGGLT